MASSRKQGGAGKFRNHSEIFAIFAKWQIFRYIVLHSEILLCRENLYGRSPPQKTKLCTISEKKNVFLFFIFCIFLVYF